MIKSQNPPFATASNASVHITNKTQVSGALESAEIRQINLAMDEESELDESLNDAVAEEEEDDELEEQKKVEAAAAANRG